MEEEDFVGCISCMTKKDLCDLYAAYSKSISYAEKFQKCFDIKMPSVCKYICTLCAHKLEKAYSFKEQVAEHVTLMVQGAKVINEEYLDEKILAEDILKKENFDIIEKIMNKSESEDVDDNSFDEEIDQYDDDEDTCSYCDFNLPCEEVGDHRRKDHVSVLENELNLIKCTLCGTSVRGSMEDHHTRCPGMVSTYDSKDFPCHFCENVYNNRKACFTHLRMKHGLKISNDYAIKQLCKQRQKCFICNKDFSQKQILNKHMWRVHGYETERRKAFICPLCSERVSYGNNFSQHLLIHGIREKIDKLEFNNMDDFMLYKSAIQEKTKFRFRKTTASKQTIDGIRSHYMCSQSGVYVYQGKGKRFAPERQIYKTGKACPAHMIVTQIVGKVLVTFHKTHVGHGTCPYYRPRNQKKSKTQVSNSCGVPGAPETDLVRKVETNSRTEGMIFVCDACGRGFHDTLEFRHHVSTHGLSMFPCQFCSSVFQNLEAWTMHVNTTHTSIFS